MQTVTFKRCLVVLGGSDAIERHSEGAFFSRTPSVLPGSDVSVLLLNSSHEMAKEITLQLQLAIPGCSIMYAPTMALGECILKRRKIDLIVSSVMLPDGGIKRLKNVLDSLSYEPDVMVVGEMHNDSEYDFSDLGYDYITKRKLAAASSNLSTTPIIHKRRVDAKIRSVGADLRNDLNNPLQEIVAMVFVAKKHDAKTITRSALEAIETAAKNLTNVVKGIEDKIKVAVNCAEDFKPL